jgi:hypothetical protein
VVQVIEMKVPAFSVAWRHQCSDRVDGQVQVIEMKVPAFSIWTEFMVGVRVVSEQSVWLLPSVFERNLQCQPVRAVDTREECHWSHACKSFNRRSKGVKLNGTQCKICLKNVHRTG